MIEMVEDDVKAKIERMDKLLKELQDEVIDFEKHKVKPVIWKTIKGYPRYKISNEGKIKTIERERKVSADKTLRFGHPTVTIAKIKDDGGRLPHIIRLDELVAINFLTNPDPSKYKTIDHIDGNLKNNRADNLRWICEDLEGEIWKDVVFYDAYEISNMGGH